MKRVLWSNETKINRIGSDGGSTPGKKGVSPFQTALLPQLLSIEEEIIISWYRLYELEWGWEAYRGLGGH